MASSALSSEDLMKELASGTATFELWNGGRFRAGLFSSISLSLQGEGKRTNHCFARITSIQSKIPSSKKKVEDYRIRKVKGDGRCLFRALALGMAINDGVDLNPLEEKIQADDLRKSVEEVICINKEQQKMYGEALIAITVEEPINRYCARIKWADFWGGESELLVLSRMYEQPIIVYIPETESKRTSSLWNEGYVPIAEYGLEYLKASVEREACKPVRLLYSGGNHYDLLL